MSDIIVKRDGVNGLKYKKVADKQDLLSKIVVTTTSGKTFDGDETARVNLMSAIISADIVGQTETEWKMADNTTQVVTLAEVKEALALAVMRVGDIVKAK